MDVVNEIKAGNTHVFEQVYHEFHARLYFFVLKRTQSKDIAEEVVQMAFIKLWEKRTTLSKEYPIEVQLARITRTTLIDVLRKQALEHKVLTSVEKDATEKFIHSDPLVFEELNNQFKEAVDSLPPTCRRIYKLSKEDGLTYKEIASLLSISSKTVETQMSKAIKTIKSRVSATVIIYLILFNII